MSSEKKYCCSSTDIESLCGFRSQKFTGVNIFFSLFLGSLFTIIFYLLLLPWKDQDILAVEMFFHGGIHHRSFIPYFTVFLTGWSLAILLIKILKLNVQRKALRLKILPDNVDFVLTPHTARNILDNINCQTDIPAKFILLDRIERALSNLKNLGNVSAVSECLKNQAENDENFLSASYTVLKGFIWAIPVLGFIGTVLGLADSVGGFGKVVSSGSGIEQIKNALTGVTNGLGVAFETTLIALVLAMIVQLLMTLVLHQEELFLDACADYCHKNLIAKMKTLSPREMEY